MKTLILIRGLDGDGKSSLARRISPWWKFWSREIASDDYPGRYITEQGIKRLNPAIDPQVPHTWAKQKVEAWMGAGVSEIVMHNTFVKLAYMDSLLELAKEYGYAVHIVQSEAVFLPSGERTRGEHNVPAEVRARWRETWERVNG